MILVAFALLAPTAAGAGDYFPTEPGTRWVYTEEADRITARVEDRVIGAIRVGERLAYSIESVYNGEKLGETYYHIDDSRVLLVAFEDAKPLRDPYAILQLPDKGKSWKFVGSADWYAPEAVIEFDGSVKQGREFTFEGKKHKTIEVRLKAQIDWFEEGVVKSDQTAVYAEGIGLVSMKETQRIGDRKTERKRELVSYHPPVGLRN